MRYFTWKLELVSNILKLIVIEFLSLLLDILVGSNMYKFFPYWDSQKKVYSSSFIVFIPLGLQNWPNKCFLYKAFKGICLKHLLFSTKNQIKSNIFCKEMIHIRRLQKLPNFQDIPPSVVVRPKLFKLLTLDVQFQSYLHSSNDNVHVKEQNQNKIRTKSRHI